MCERTDLVEIFNHCNVTKHVQLQLLTRRRFWRQSKLVGEEHERFHGAESETACANRQVP